MTITFNGITIPKGMVWQERYNEVPIAGSRVTTLGGTAHVYEQDLQNGQEITLASLRDQGWMDKATLDQVYPLSKVVGASYTLVIYSETFTVKFRHYDSPPIEVSPLIPRGTPTAEDYFLVTLKLVQV